MPTIIFTVTNDLSYDQRMIRICTSLARNGYDIKLIGRKLKSSLALDKKLYDQHRISCWFIKGKLFYAEYNIRLFFYLLFIKMDCICAVDLDTIIPCYYISRLKRVIRVLDAHEYFSQQKEIVTRPAIYKTWLWIERNYQPKFLNGYTVGACIAEQFKKDYGLRYMVIRNVPLLKEEDIKKSIPQESRIVLYQGAVNEGRGLEFLIPAMKNIEGELHIYGDGNFLKQTIELISINNLQDKVFIKGKLLPDELLKIANQAYIGINLVENTGLNQYFSLANKFFDFIHGSLPQVTMNFPEYKKLNDEFNIALLIDDLRLRTIEESISRLMNDEKLYARLRYNCLAAMKKLNWQNEEKNLLTFYKKILGKTPAHNNS